MADENRSRVLESRDKENALMQLNNSLAGLERYDLFSKTNNLVIQLILELPLELKNTIT